jgi:hypothetical protein
MWFPALGELADHHIFTSEHHSSSPRYVAPASNILTALSSIPAQLPPLCPYFLHPVQHAALLHRRTPPYLRQRGLAPHPQLSVRCHRLALRRMVHAPLRSVLENTGARLPRTPHGELRPRFLVHDHSSFSCHPRVAYCQYRSARTPEWVLYTTLMPAVRCVRPPSFALCSLHYHVYVGARLCRHPDDDAASAHCEHSTRRHSARHGPCVLLSSIRGRLALI